MLAGHVRQKPKGTGLYYPVTEHRRADGSRYQKWHSPGFRTEREAKKQLARLRVDLERGDWIERTQLTVGDYLEKRWLPAVVGSVRATTYSGYEGHVRRYIKPRLGGMRLQDLSPEALSAFYATLKIEGGQDGKALASATVQRVHATLHRALRDAAQWGLVIRNVAALAIKPRDNTQRAHKTRAWTADELGRFLRAASSHRFGAAFNVAAYTGMRRGELAGLRWEDTDLDGKVVMIWRARTTVGQTVVTDDPKSAASRRSIEIEPVTVQALKAWRKVQNSERLAAGPAWIETGFVFTYEDGRPLHPNMLTKYFLAISRGASVPPLRLHDLRHTHATLLLKAGVPAKVVSERIGHSNVAFTLSTYQHVLPGMGRDASATFAALLDTPGAAAGAENAS